VAKRKKQVIKHTEIQKTESTSVNNVNEEMLSNAIIKALLEYDQRKEREAQDKSKKEQAEIQKSLGIKEGKPKFFAALKLLFRPKKYAKSIQANTELTRLVLKLIYKVVEWVLLLLSIFMIAAVPLQFIIPGAPIVAWYIDVVIVVWAFPIFLLSRIFRMASYEIDRIKDYNYLFGLFATVTSIISIVIAIIAIVK
jgi:hypothetical protein